MRAPELTRALRRELTSLDVVHVHLARDLVTLPAALAVRKSDVAYVVQPHGMIDASDRLLAGPLDAYATKPVLRGASAVLALTDQEDRDIRTVERGSNVLPIANGIRVGEMPRYEGRKNIVLFLARLHERKRPIAFVQMATMLVDSFPGTDFVLAGPDEGEAPALLAAIEAAGVGDRVRWVGPAAPSATDALISSARAYVLPSVNEVFPMTILESLRVGTPVVTTDSLGIASACERYGAAMITDGSPAELANAVARVLGEHGVAEGLRAGGHEYLRAELDIARVVDDLENLYSRHAVARA
ncbi:glycosyltransferase [soil metagenome]